MKMALNYYMWSWLQAFITMISEPAKTNSSKQMIQQETRWQQPTKESEQNEWKQALSFSGNGFFSFCENIQWKKEKVISMDDSSEDKSSSSLKKKKTFMQQINADNTSHSFSSHLERRRSSHTCAQTQTHTHTHKIKLVLSFTSHASSSDGWNRAQTDFAWSGHHGWWATPSKRQTLWRRQ